MMLDSCRADRDGRNNSPKKNTRETVPSTYRGNMMSAQGFDNIDSRSNGNSSNAREGVQSSGTRPTRTGMIAAGSGRPGGNRVFEMGSDLDEPSGQFDHLAERN